MTTAPEVTDTWHNRDLPVLRQIVCMIEGDPTRRPSPQHIAAEFNLSNADVQRAVGNLKRGELVRPVGPQRGGRMHEMLDITHAGLLQSGAWPTPETALDRMITALEAIADNTDDDDTRTKARKLLDALRGAGTTVATSVATAAITGHLPT